ncbi:TIGR02265 family protein [Vitiosangium sp. GDMCC 1.1324]|nr:TIGR02265 family protein [Vitiosangium sp. GDMCC 1.1324]
MFFNGLLDAVRALGGEEIRARCFAASGEKRFVDFFSYPVADFLKGLFTAVELLGPKHGGADAVLRQLGRRATGDFLQSTVGKTMMALAGTDPQRLLASFPSAYRASLSYGERFVERVGDRQVKLMARRDFLPLAYNEGVLIAALEQSTAKELVVMGNRLAPLDVDYDIRWS